MKNVLIVGASSGIGEKLAQDLLDKGGWNLYLASRNEPNLQGDFYFQKIDILEEFELEVPDSLDALVYCPGSINLKPFHRIKDEEFLLDFKLNTMGAIQVIRQSLKALKNAESASIVLFSTVAVQTGLSFHTSVAASKGAIEGLGRSLAAELAPSIRVNMIAPSLTDTPLAERLLSSEDKKKANAERHPLKRIGTAADIANAATFLIDETGSWITGQTITIDGGIGTIR